MDVERQKANTPQAKVLRRESRESAALSKYGQVKR